MTKVSVILTSFNHAEYLRESIESVLNQTFTDFELIIRDDASTDASWAIINSYSDPRIQALRNETNRRAIYGINEAISKVAKGRYIAIHHSDDAWEAHKLEEQVAFLDKHPETGAVFTNAMILGERGEPFENKAHFYYSIFDQPNRSRHEWLNHFFYHGNALCHPSVLIRKICYGKCGLYRYGFSQITDFDMWVRLCLKYEIHVMPEKLVRFRVLDNMANVSAGREDGRIRVQFEQFQVLDNYRDLSKYEELLRIFPAAQKYHRPEGFDAQFVLGMLALEAPPHKYNELFGLQVLFEALNDPSRARKIRKLYDFDVNKFRELSGGHDVFSFLQLPALLAELEALRREMQAQLSMRDTSLTSLNAQLEQKDATLKTLTARLEQEKTALTSLTTELGQQAAELKGLSMQLEQKEQSLHALLAQLAAKRQAAQALALQVSEQDGMLHEIYDSRAWKLLRFLREIRLKLIPRDSFRERGWYSILRLFGGK